jgi:hypothetical protein
MGRSLGKVADRTFMECGCVTLKSAFPAVVDLF